MADYKTTDGAIKRTPQADLDTINRAIDIAIETARRNMQIPSHIGNSMAARVSRTKQGKIRCEFTIVTELE